MRQVVLAHQSLLNPPAAQRLHQPEVLTIETARELLGMGAERGLKSMFRAAVYALNHWRGRWSPLPSMPERCTLQEILDLLEQHPSWFVPGSAAAG
jgi:hypothetical protein